MSHRFALKEIAIQAGVSLATVDRAVNGRGQVRESTMQRIAAAIGELERQEALAAVSGRRLVFDMVMEAPDRFSSIVRAALEQELSGLRPANVRCRFHFAEVFGDQGVVSVLRAIRRRGSHGVILKAADTDDVRDIVGQILTAGIPVVSFVTDLSDLPDVPYVGMDNKQAGATAAWCMAVTGGERVRAVLATLSSARFKGEAERLNAFTTTLSELMPSVPVLRVSEGFGTDRPTRAMVGALLDEDGSINAVYSAGGGNRAILECFREKARTIEAFIAHDLDADNRILLADGQIDAVLHHDLRRDTRTAMQLLLRHHRMLPADFVAAPTNVDIATRFNLPGYSRG